MSVKVIFKTSSGDVGYEMVNKENLNKFLTGALKSKYEIRNVAGFGFVKEYIIYDVEKVKLNGELITNALLNNKNLTGITSNSSRNHVNTVINTAINKAVERHSKGLKAVNDEVELTVRFSNKTAEEKFKNSLTYSNKTAKEESNTSSNNSLPNTSISNTLKKQRKNVSVAAAAAAETFLKQQQKNASAAAAAGGGGWQS